MSIIDGHLNALQVSFQAIRGETGTGFTALDSLKWSTDEIECPILPAQANPQPCEAGQFECHSDSTCISETQICDFWKDCTDGEDEKFCPLEYLFENCGDLCYWTEEPTDQLDWLVATGNLYSYMNTSK